MHLYSKNAQLAGHVSANFKKPGGTELRGMTGDPVQHIFSLYLHNPSNTCCTCHNSLKKMSYLVVFLGKVLTMEQPGEEPVKITDFD